MRAQTKGGIGVVIIALVAIGAVLFLNRGGSAPTAVETTSDAQDSLLVREDSRVVGEPARSGDVTLVEFLDFECEACGSVYPAVEQLRAEYDGRVTFVARYFPLPGHVNAEPAARAVESAARQGEFEAMYQMMYETQTEWGESQDPKDDVWLWVGIVPVSLLLGPVVRLASPARTIHLVLVRATGGDPDQGVATMPPWLGYWPAAIGLFAFVWLELVYPGATYLGPLRLWFALYLAVTVIGAAVFGQQWLARTDPFEVYASLVARLSIWGRRADGTLIVVNPLRNMTGLRGEAGLVAVVAVLLGSTAFDSFRESPVWVRFSQRTLLDNTALDTGVLLAACALVGVSFFIAVAAAGPGNDGAPRRHMPRQLAASIVPVIVGYMVAHYLTLFVEVGQQTLAQVSDPLSNGSDLFGTGDLSVSYFLSTNPTLLAVIKVLAIVIGHVLGVIVAHDRSLQLLPPRRHLVGQLPLLGAMTLYTFTGLYLLFGL